MKFAEYSSLALRTCPLPTRVGGQPNLVALDMATLGLVGEAAEIQAALDPCIPAWVAGFPLDHFTLEVGDGLWYLSLAALVLDTSLEEIVSQATGRWVVEFESVSKAPETWYVKSLLGFMRASGLFADEVKKVLHHGHPINQEKLVRMLVDVFYHLWHLCGNLPWDVSFALAAQRNIDRLRSRYPDGFAETASINRM